MIQSITLKEARVGETIQWDTRPFGAVFADILEQFDTHALVRADNDITYEWPHEMIVVVDR